MLVGKEFFPLNSFQELIQWTDASLMWKYPIDNEQGISIGGELDRNTVSAGQHHFGQLLYKRVQSEVLLDSYSSIRAADCSCWL